MIGFLCWLSWWWWCCCCCCCCCRRRRRRRRGRVLLSLLLPPLLLPLPPPLLFIVFTACCVACNVSPHLQVAHEFERQQPALEKLAVNFNRKIGFGGRTENMQARQASDRHQARREKVRINTVE
jgi:hypothetical protein